jgi:hypothetical protein
LEASIETTSREGGRGKRYEALEQSIKKGEVVGLHTSIREYSDNE